MRGDDNMISGDEKILYKDLSYKLQGLFFAIRNDLGSGHKESIYQKALEKELMSAGIEFTREPAIKIYSRKGEFLGLYRPDFLIENKIIVELKATDHVSRQEITRVYDYLRNSEYELAYLVNFASLSLFTKRLIFTNDRKNPRIAHNSRMATNGQRIATNAVAIFVAISAVFVAIRGVQAAEIYFGAQSPKIQTGQRFEVGVFVNTGEDAVNAVEAKIVFPADRIEVKEVRDGGSIVNLWLERPRLSATGEISFSGVLPGGFRGKRGQLFSLVLEAKQTGSAVLSARDEQVLRHDGEGTALAVTRAPISFVVEMATTTPPSFLPPYDPDPPEPFVPQVTKLDDVFEGKYVVIFATQDKGSGIQRYEVAEKYLWPWQRGVVPSTLSWTASESPHILADQSLQSTVFVKAVDLAGNERIESVPPRYAPWYEKYAAWGILALIAIVLVLVGIILHAYGGRSRRRL